MDKEVTYNELLSLRAMAQLVVEEADRLIKEKQQPVSTGRCKKSVEKFLEKRAKTRARRILRNQKKN